MLKIRENDLAYREIDGEIVLLDLTGSRYLKLNECGSVLWPLLVEGTDEETLSEHLVKTFDIDAATAGHDVDSFIASLRDRGLLEG